MTMAMKWARCAERYAYRPEAYIANLEYLEQLLRNFKTRLCLKLVKIRVFLQGWGVDKVEGWSRIDCRYIACNDSTVYNVVPDYLQ